MTDRLTRLTRSMLFVPAARPDMIAKAARSAADAVCLDLEDSVAADQKEASRAHIIQALQTLDFGRRVRLLRINALDTPFAYRDVIEVVEAAGRLLDLIMLPKVNAPRDVQFLDTLLTQIEAHAGIARPIGNASMTGFRSFSGVVRSSRSTPSRQSHTPSSDCAPVSVAYFRPSGR